MAIRKQWYKVASPEMFGGKVIAETRADDPEKLIGRVLEVSLVELTNDIKKFYIKVKLRITKVDGDTCRTEIVGHDCMRERISRLVQRRTKRVDVIRDILTKDSKPARIKVLIIAGRNISIKVKSAMRKAVFEYIDSLKDLEFEKIMEKTFSGELEKEIKKIASKYYPVFNVEIRRIDLLTERKAKRTVLKEA